MSEPIDAEDVSIEHGGRMYHGRYYIQDDTLFCRYKGELKATSTGLTDPQSTARHLLREMVTSTESEA